MMPVPKINVAQYGDVTFPLFLVMIIMSAQRTVVMPKLVVYIIIILAMITMNVLVNTVIVRKDVFMKVLIVMIGIV